MFVSDWLLYLIVRCVCAIHLHMRRARLACMYDARSIELSSACVRLCLYVCLELPSSFRLLSALLCYSKYISILPFANVRISQIH